MQRESLVKKKKNPMESVSSTYCKMQMCLPEQQQFRLWLLAACQAVLKMCLRMGI